MFIYLNIFYKVIIKMGNQESGHDYNDEIEEEVTRGLQQFKRTQSKPIQQPKLINVTNDGFNPHNQAREYNQLKQLNMNQTYRQRLAQQQNPYVINNTQSTNISSHLQQQQKPYLQQQQTNKEQQQKDELKKLYKQQLQKQSQYTKEEKSAMKIFKLDSNFTIKQLKDEFKKLALQTHPDKGGDKHLFMIITKAYARLLKNIKKRTKQQNFFELKSESQNYNESQPKKNNLKFNQENNGGFNLNRFNKIYSDNRLEDEEEEGYEDWIMKNLPEESTDNPKILKKFNKKSFHTQFEKEKDKQTGTEIIKYEEPKPMAISNRVKYTELGGKRPDSYGQSYNINNHGIGYTDFKEAHTKTVLINPKIIKKRKIYRDVQDIEDNRGKISYKLSEKDRKYQEKKKKMQELHEKQRIQRLRKRDITIEKHFDKINKLMLGN